MTTTTIEQWFDIERVVTDVHTLLAQTRARSLESSAWPEANDGGDTTQPTTDERWMSGRPASSTRFDFIATRAVSSEAPVSPSVLPEPLFGRPLAVAEVALEAPPTPSPGA